MKFTILLSVLLLVVLAGCTPVQDVETTNTQEDVSDESEMQDIPEMQDNETTDHMSVVGQTNQFLSIVGTDKNISVMEQYVTYHQNTTGYLVRPNDGMNYPGIIMIHEWWGLNEHIKEVAKTLAMEGYVVLAVDLYNGEVASNSSEAMTLRRSINQTLATENMKAGIKYLNSINVERVASMGFCFGGEQSAQLSVSNADLDATVIYYGSLPQNQEEISRVDAPVLGIFGELDTGITPETVRVFESGLENASLEHDITIYDGVGHAFINPEGSRFAINETKDAWSKTISFLDTNLKN